MTTSSNTSPNGLLNVFEPGLIRGAARLAYAPHKRYFYVEHPDEGWRVYMRACSFLHDSSVPFNSKEFLVVKRKGEHGANVNPNDAVWEPPKGQMEGKDAKPDSAPLVQLMAENIKREVNEEAKIEKITKLRYTGLVLQGREKDYPPNHYFQYHLFQAFVSPSTISKALAKFKWLNEHPKAFERLRKDNREKDALEWFDAKKTKLMGKWSPSIVALYISNTNA
jgi:ADP-ribose pyrophosphatase YjhB (NUDIX family)